MIGEIIKIIENSGVTIVMSTLMIFLFYRQYIKMEHMNKQFVKYLTGRTTQQNAHKKGLQDRIDIADKINAIIKNIAMLTQASRVYIMEFHNTSNNMTGLPFAKFSMTYEFFSEGNSPAINHYQNMSLSLISSILTDLYKNSYLIIDSDDHTDDKIRSLQWFLTQSQSKTTIFVPLKDTNGKIFGVAGMDFKNKQDRGHWTSEELEKCVFVECGRVSGYLDFAHL